MIYRVLCAAILLSFAVVSPAQAQKSTTPERPTTTKPGIAQSQTPAVNPGAVRAPTISSPVREKPTTLKKPGVAQATISKSCKGKDGKTTTYTVSVEGGDCGQIKGSAICENKTNGDWAEANCTEGCVGSKGNGSCTIAVAR